MRRADSPPERAWVGLRASSPENSIWPRRPRSSSCEACGSNWCFFVKIDQPASGDITDYARVEDFSTGEVWAQWKTAEGEFAHRVFVSRPDNVIVLKLAAPKGKLTCSLSVPTVGNDKIKSTVVHAKDLITLHNVYVNGKGGYDCAVRVAVAGGTVACDGQSIQLANADAATFSMRVEPATR